MAGLPEQQAEVGDHEGEGDYTLGLRRVMVPWPVGHASGLDQMAELEAAVDPTRVAPAKDPEQSEHEDERRAEAHQRRDDHRDDDLLDEPRADQDRAAFRRRELGDGEHDDGWTA